MLSFDSRQFALRLSQFRDQASLTQEELAERIGVSPKTISNWEREKAYPKVVQLAALCRALGTSADALLGLPLRDSAHVEEASGLKWRVVSPYNPESDREIADSVRLFELMVREHMDYLAIQKTRYFAGYSMEKLRLLLRKALVSGVIQFLDVARDYGLEEKLRAAYPAQLRRCFVADTKYKIDHLLDATLRTEAVAFLAAREVESFLPSQGAVGLTGGSTISRFVDLLPPASPALRGLSLVPLLVPKEQETRTGLSANSVITRLMYKQPGATAFRLSYVDPSRRERAYWLSADANERAVLERLDAVLRTARSASVAFVSVGTPEFDYRTSDAYLGLPDLGRLLGAMPDETRRACVGDLLLRLVDADGHRLGDHDEQTANDALVHSISLEDLRQIAIYGTVWALSARSTKAAVLRAALLSKTVNSLVIDSSVAEALLRLQSG